VTTLIDSLPTADELSARGLVRFSAGDPAGAERCFRAATEVDPDFAPAWNNLGTVLQTRGQWSEACRAYDCALAARPDYPEALLNRARCRFELGRPEEALDDCTRAAALAPPALRPSALHNRGTLRHRSGDLAGAEADLTRAIELDPGRVDARVNRAAARKDSGDLAGALADLELALEQLPPGGRAGALHVRGGVRALRDDFRGALADYDAALALEPDNVCFLISRANARYHLRDPLARADYRRAFRTSATAAAAECARFLTADARRRAGAVLDNCDKHVRINPDDALAYARRGLTLVLLGREDEARADFERCRERAGEQWPDLRLVLAAVRRTMRRERTGAVVTDPTEQPHGMV
jgi:tetratricopeptide (TPR) repeat protein